MEIKREILGYARPSGYRRNIFTVCGFQPEEEDYDAKSAFIRWVKIRLLFARGPFGRPYGIHYA